MGSLPPRRLFMRPVLVWSSAGRSTLRGTIFTGFESAGQSVAGRGRVRTKPELNNDEGKAESNLTGSIYLQNLPVSGREIRCPEVPPLTYTEFTMTISLNPSIVRCAVYLRSATDDRASLLRQEEACRAAAVRQNPAWHIDDDLIFADTAMSGLSHDRPGLNSLLQRAADQPRPSDYVIIESPDRFSRSQATSWRVIDDLAGHGVGIYVASMGIDSRNPKLGDFLGPAADDGAQFSRAFGDTVHRGERAAMLQS